MTISSENFKDQYWGDGVTAAFNVTTQFQNASELLVTLLDVDGINEIPRTLTTHYTVTGGNGGIGQVIFTSGNIPTGNGTPGSQKVTITRAMPFTQQTDLTPNDPFPADTVERSLGDRLIMIVQQQQEQINRCLKLLVSTSLSAAPPVYDPVANKVLVANALGNAIIPGPDVADIIAAAANAAAVAADRAQVQILADQAAASAAAAAAAGAGLQYRSVLFATTANDSLSGLAARDGVTPIAGDRCLVKNQTLPAANGIYVAAAGAWTRATDMDVWTEVINSIVVVTSGTANANSVWLCTSSGGGTIGVTAITFIDYGATIVNGTIVLAKLAPQAANTILANATGSSAGPTAVAVGANTFLARAAAGNVAAKTISEDALAFVAAANNGAMRAALGGAASGANTDITSITAYRPENLQTASYTLVLGDFGKNIRMNNASANNLTIPLNATVAFPVGTEIDICQYGAGQTTVVATGGVTIRSKSGNLKLTGQYSGATLKKIGTDEWMLFGDLAA